MRPSNVNFIPRIPMDLDPRSTPWKNFWRETKRRCIEGFWFEGVYMPGPLYFYANLGRILMNVNKAKTKSVGQPSLRDIEWDKAYVYLEAKGFSGFEEDKDITCSWFVYEVLSCKDPVKKEALLLDYIIRQKITEQEVTNPSSFPLEPKLKAFENPRAYIKKQHSKNLGKAIYRNNAKNVMDIEARRVGKSVFAGNALINHNFLFDGATDYDVYLDAKNNGKPLSSETLVGAIDSKYTKDLLSKSEIGLSNLPGSKVVNDIYFPSPLSKLTTGTFAAGKYMEASFKVKQVGGWTVKGSRSKIHNRSFADNPLAGNGTGPNLIVLEEVGFMTNLIDTLGALKDATYEGLDKFGVIFMTGTGGEMDAAAVSQTKEVFFNPATYDCLEFENTWSNSSEKIGYFVPYHKRLDEYRDNEGVLDVVRAKKAVADKREEIKKSGKQRAFYSEIQNNPEAPEEAFMVDNANLFPTAELKEHLGWLQSKQQDVDIRGQYGELVFTPDAGGAVTLNWKPDLKKVLEPCGFRMRPSDNTKGCIVIWEHPVKQNGHIPYGLYIAGTDPYDQDQAESSVSLGSTFIYKTFQTLEGVYEWPVAEYTARPGSAEEHHENVRKLLMYYNAIDLYENERNTLKMHFSHKHSLHLLAKTPTILKATENSKVNRGYGIHMNMYIKDEIEIYTRDWLQTDIGDGRLNLHKIMSIPLLQELIDYNKTGNFDRVIAFMLCILHRLQNHHIKVADAKQKTLGERDSFFSRSNKFFK